MLTPLFIRSFFCSCIMLLLPLILPAQSLQAKYMVTTSMNMPLASGKQKQISLEYTGLLYRKGNRYIYFEKPEYLSKYPDGEIVIEEGNSTSTFGLDKDPIQGISYTDYDSLVTRWRDSYIPGVISNHMQYFDSSFLSWKKRRWQIENVIKDIQGLQCRKASWAGQWIVWFCPDIPMESGIGNISGVPGLIVEADRLADGKHYTLISYNTNENLPDHMFWPTAFNESFIKENNFKTTSDKNKSNKQQKRLELLDQP